MEVTMGNRYRTCPVGGIMVEVVTMGNDLCTISNMRRLAIGQTVVTMGNPQLMEGSLMVTLGNRPRIPTAIPTIGRLVGTKGNLSRTFTVGGPIATFANSNSRLQSTLSKCREREGRRDQWGQGARGAQEILAKGPHAHAQTKRCSSSCSKRIARFTCSG